MDKRTLSVSVRGLLITVLIAFACVPRVEAATRTWSGNTNGNMSLGSNWVGGIAPSANDDLVFPSVATTTAVNQDIVSGMTFNSITFFGAPYTLSGLPIRIGAGGLGVSSTSAVTVTISLTITLTAAQTWGNLAMGTATLAVSGPVHLNGQSLTFTILAPAVINVSGVIDGTGAITKSGPGLLNVSGANTYAGQTTILEGTLVALNATALGVADGTLANGTIITDNGSTQGTLSLKAVAIGNEAISISATGHFGNPALRATNGASSIAGPITLDGGWPIVTNLATASLNLTGVISGSSPLALGTGGVIALGNSGNTFTGGVNMHWTSPNTNTLVINADQALPGDQVIDLDPGNTFVVNGHAQTVQAVTGSGTVVLATGGGPNTLTLDGTADATFAGQFTGAGLIAHTGTGHQTFTGVSTMTGLLLVDHGMVTVATGQVPAAVSIDNDGHFSLMSNGTAGSILVTADGHLQLSEGGAATGNSGPITLHAGTTFDVGGTAPLSLGKLTVAGAVTLGGATLALHLPAGFDPDTDTVFTLIDNDGADAVSGTFAGLAEGATFTVGRFTFKISYVGGTGNDVTLTVAAVSQDYLLTEGADSTFFTTDILLANPNGIAAPIHITFLKEDGTTITKDDTLPAMSHKFLRVNTVPGMESTAFSTIVSSTTGLSLVVERTMSWDSTGYGAHTEHATAGADTTWYFAEGSQGFFHTYLLLANPQTTPNTATVQYLIEGGAPITRTYPLAATSRFTVDVGADAALVNQSFGMTVTFAQPGAAERAMYFGDVPLFNGGHESAGVNAPSTTWFLAEGATGPFFETFVLLANPGDTDATATLTYLPLGGSPITATKAVPAHARVTVNLEGESPALSNAAVSTQVVSTQPLLVERSQYWPDPAPNWYEAHNSFGVTSLGTKWGLSEGRVGNVDGDTNAQTYILLANPGTTAAHVTIKFLRDDPATNVTHTFTVDPTTRFNVPVGPGTSVPELTNEHFGALVTSDQPIAVERALYWDANGQVWAAGTNATATPLP